MSTLATPSATPAAVRALRTTRAPLSIPRSTTSTRRDVNYSTVKPSIILDLGSAIWKVGVAGEVNPRACMRNEIVFERDDEEADLVRHALQTKLRKVWLQHIGLDPKTRNVVILESPLFPSPLKEIITNILFQNLQVPTVSFVPSGLMALMAVGKVTGLVIDCGNSQTTVLPVYCSRPLNHHLVTTPVAATRFSIRLKGLLLQFASYIPPPLMINSSIPPPERIPPSVLTESLIEEIKTRLLFIGDPLQPSTLPIPSRTLNSTDEHDETEDLAFLNYLEEKLSKTSTANSVTIKIPNQSNLPSGVGRGWIVVPGWIRERAGEVFFEEGNEDELSLVEVILSSVLKLPIDLRRPLISSILITGGTVMLPGFLPRLEQEIQNQIQYSRLSQLGTVVELINLKNGFSSSLLSWIGGSLSSDVGLVAIDVKKI